MKPVVSFAVFFFFAGWIQECRAGCYVLAGTETNITCYDSTRSADGLLWRAEVGREIIGVANCTRPGSCVSLYPDSFDASLDNSASYLTIKNASRTHPFNMDETRWFCTYHTDGYKRTSCRYDYFHVFEKAKNFTCGPISVNRTTWELSITCSTERIYPQGLCELDLHKTKNDIWQWYFSANKYNHTELNDTVKYYRTECSFKFSFGYLGIYGKYYSIRMTPTWFTYLSHVNTGMKEIQLGPVDCYPLAGTETNITCTDPTRSAAGLLWRAEVDGEIMDVANCISPGSCVSRYPDSFDAFLDGEGSYLTIKNASRKHPFNMDTRWFCSYHNDKYNLTSCSHMYVLEKAKNLTCGPWSLLNSTTLKLSITCSTERIYPGGTCVLLQSKDKYTRIPRRRFSHTSVHTQLNNTLEYYRTECSFNFPVHFVTDYGYYYYRILMAPAWAFYTNNEAAYVYTEMKEIKLDCPRTNYGRFCDSVCSTNCTNQYCSGEIGTCDECPQGRTGDYCDEDCPRTNYGRFCDGVCSTNCINQFCSGENGTCDDCPQGRTGDNCDEDCPRTYYGRFCDGVCSTNCINQFCSGDNGTCDDCPPGKTGDYCHEECPRTNYGLRCEEMCSTNCTNQYCSGDNGTCDDCPQGKTGDFCDKDLCPKEFCKNEGRCVGLYTCDCTSTDFFGPTCQNKTKEPSSDSSPLEIAQIIGIAVGCLVGLVFSTVTVVGLAHYIRRDSRKQSGIEQSTSQTPNPQGDGGYITPVDSPYSMEYIIPSEDYLSPVGENIHSSADYDYIKHDYLELQPETTFTTQAPALPNPRAVSKR